MWKPYPRDRLIKDDDGFFVIVPKDSEPAIPLGCSVCHVLYRSRDDEQAHVEYGCCHMCALRWAHANREKWLSGWRPDPPNVLEEVSKRPKIRIAIDLD